MHEAGFDSAKVIGGPPVASPRQRETLTARTRLCSSAHKRNTTRSIADFWSLVSAPPDMECWLWNGDILDNGYGRFSRVLLGERLAHRIAYRMVQGAIAEGLQIDHLCRNKRCVNPQHLEPVTQTENLRRGHLVIGRYPKTPKRPPRHADGEVIDRIGGAGYVGRRLGIKVNTVSRWRIRGIAKHARAAVAQLAVSLSEAA